MRNAAYRLPLSAARSMLLCAGLFLSCLAVLGQQPIAEPIEIIEMQLEGGDTSRNVWIVVHEERAYLPANLGFPPGKNWHLAADQDGAAQLRIETRLYDVALRRISDAAQAAQVFASLEAKYPSGASEGVEYWFFAVEPR